MIEKIKKIKIFFILTTILVILILNKTFALDVYQECRNIGNNWGGSKILCDDNYFLYYNLKSLHNTVEQIIIKDSTKITEIENNLANILNILKNDNEKNNIFSEKEICNYFFKQKICNNEYYDNIKDLSIDDFIENFNKNGTLPQEIIKKNILNGKDSNSKIEIFETIQRKLNSFRNNLDEFETTLGVILTKGGKFSFSNVIFGTNNINLWLKALSDPKISNDNKDIKHYKIGLLNIAKPFLNLSNDLFIALPVTGRFIANPYIVFGIIWYYLVYYLISLMILFLIVSAFFYPLIQVTEDNKKIFKRRIIWLFFSNSSEFNFFGYLYTIFLTNKNYTFKYDISGKEITVINQFRVPFIVKPIIREDYVGLGVNLMIWIFIFLFLQIISGYLIS